MPVISCARLLEKSRVCEGDAEPLSLGVPHTIIRAFKGASGGSGAAVVAAVAFAMECYEKSIEIFEDIERYKNEIPLQKIILIVILCLFFAGLVEGHLTQKLFDSLL